MRIITRTQAGLRPPTRAPIRPPRPAAGVVGHHTVTGPGEVELVRDVQRGHMDHRRWSDIAYSFVVTSSGKIVEGRGWDWDHLTVRGRDTISVCLVGRLHQDPATPAQIEAFGWLIAHGILAGYLAGGWLGGHRDFAPPGRWTECPGAHGLAAGRAAHALAVDIIHRLAQQGGPPPMVIVVHPSGHREMSDGIRRRPFINWDEFCRYRDAGVPIVELTADQFHALEPAGRR